MTFTTWAEAKQEADERDLRVHGLKDPDNERWLYFTTPQDATDDQIQAAAFESRHGRPMSENEMWLVGLARASGVDF